MLAAYTKSEKQNKAFSLMGAQSLLGSSREVSTQNSVSLITSANDNCGGVDICSFANLFSEPSESTLLTFAESQESCGSIAYSEGGETTGSIAYAGSSESCGSIACSFSSTSSCGSTCSFSC